MENCKNAENNSKDFVNPRLHRFDNAVGCDEQMDRRT